MSRSIRAPTASATARGARVSSVQACSALGASPIAAASARLTDELWGDDSPQDAPAALQAHVSRLVDLSDLAGSQVLVAFRYMTDGFVDHPGLWIDNLAMGSTLVSDGATLDGWKTATEIRPVAIARISLRLIAYDSHHRRAFVTDVKLDADNDGQLTPAQRAAIRATDASTVAAIVNHYEPTEDVNQPAPYALTANGVLQPGGGTEEP